MDCSGKNKPIFVDATDTTDVVTQYANAFLDVDFTYNAEDASDFYDYVEILVLYTK